jgi:hypothetical protein
VSEGDARIVERFSVAQRIGLRLIMQRCFEAVKSRGREGRGCRKGGDFHDFGDRPVELGQDRSLSRITERAVHKSHATWK